METLSVRLQVHCESSPRSEEGRSHRGRVGVGGSVVVVWETWISDWKFLSRKIGTA